MSTPNASTGDCASGPDLNSIAWNELITPDTAEAVKFYGGLFGWTTEAMPMPGMTYTMFKHDGESFGGVMAPPQPGIPPHWLNYISSPMSMPRSPKPLSSARPSACRRRISATWAASPC